MARIELLTGEAIPLVREKHSSKDYIEFLKILDSKYPRGDRIRIILDNLKVHTSEITRNYLATVTGSFEFKMTIRRCQILLELDQNAPQNLTQMQIARTFGVSKATVSNIVAAYVKGGIPAIIKINRNPRLNARRKLDGRMEAEILCIDCFLQ